MANTETAGTSSISCRSGSLPYNRDCALDVTIPYPYGLLEATLPYSEERLQFRDYGECPLGLPWSVPTSPEQSIPVCPTQDFGRYGVYALEANHRVRKNADCNIVDSIWVRRWTD